MKKVITILFSVLLLIETSTSDAQTLWFGTVKTQDKITQGRFEVVGDNEITAVTYAPYGITPAVFKDVKQQKNQLTFIWTANETDYHCLLVKQNSGSFEGNCAADKAPAIQLVMRQFSEADAILQGDSLHASEKDLVILDRALALLNNGANWNHVDKRVCDNGSYPYKWSLFCALHQASIDVDSEYRHLRPAVQATRQAINEITAGKKYAHLLQDYNNEAESFDAVAKALNRAKEIIGNRIKQHK
jgi:hypothetical protein